MRRESVLYRTTVCDVTGPCRYDNGRHPTLARVSVRVFLTLANPKRRSRDSPLIFCSRRPRRSLLARPPAAQIYASRRGSGGGLDRLCKDIIQHAIHQPVQPVHHLRHLRPSPSSSTLSSSSRRASTTLRSSTPRRSTRSRSSTPLRARRAPPTASSTSPPIHLSNITIAHLALDRRHDAPQPRRRRAHLRQHAHLHRLGARRLGQRLLGQRHLERGSGRRARGVA